MKGMQLRGRFSLRQAPAMRIRTAFCRRSKQPSPPETFRRFGTTIVEPVHPPAEHGEHDAEQCAYPLMLGASGSFFTCVTPSEMIFVNCITDWLNAAYSTMSR
jgi:hypothetical protein